MIEAFGVHGIAEVGPGDDVAELIVAALASRDRCLLDGDVLVISSKVLSKAEGRAVVAVSGESRDQAIDGQSVRIVAERITPRGVTRIVESRSGPVLAAAGVDASNVSPGTVLLLPVDPDASARRVCDRLRALTGCRIGVIVSDTAGRAWRDGQVDIAIGAAGVAVIDDLRGGVDPYGNPLEVTVRAVADELAALADLIKGKVDGVPAAVVRGLPELVGDVPGGAAVLLRPAGQDWFRLGHVEAVRTALGVAPGTAQIAPLPLLAGSVQQRLARAVAVAGAGRELLVPATHPDPHPVTVSTGPGGLVSLRSASTAEALITLGGFVQRVIAAGWTENLLVHATRESDGSISLVADPIS